MAFDIGFDFRGTAGFVTDPAYGVPVLAEAYPHTYTNGNGDSINAGWTAAASIGVEDDTASNDPRIAGANNLQNNGTPKVFRVDLSSGSAPGAGTYTVDCAIGTQSATRLEDFQIKDDATLLIDGTNGGAGYTTLANHFIDATLTDVMATTAWTGTPVAKTFATTTVNLNCGLDNISGFTFVAHFRLTLQGGGGGVVVSPRLLMLLGVGA